MMMKKFQVALAAIALLCASVAHGQAYWTPGATIGAIASTGSSPLRTLPGAMVTVCAYPATRSLGGPCTNLATLYTDATGTTACNGINGCSNPLYADNQANFGFWAAPGHYQYTVTYLGSTASATYDVTVSSGSGAQLNIPNTWTATQTFTIANNELNGALYASPEAAVTAACSNASWHAVYFPTGTYNTAGIPACSNLHIRCASGDIVAAAGVVFNVTGANWGLYNASADLGSGNNQVRNLTIDSCGFTIAANASALGAIRMKGIKWSTFNNVVVYTNGNTNPAITFDGANFAHNGGDYDNAWNNLQVYDNSTTASDIGLYFTDSSSTGSCANENKFFGGTITQFGTAIKIDCGNNNQFFGQDLENWRNYAIYLTAINGTGGGAATSNLFISPRLESASTLGTGIQIDNTLDGSSKAVVKFNHIERPYMAGGTFTYMTDNTGANVCVDCATDQSGAIYQTLFNTPSANGVHYVGINRTPAQVKTDLGSFTGGLDIGGLLNVTGKTTFNDIPTLTTTSGQANFNLRAANNVNCFNYGVAGSSSNNFVECGSNNSWSIYDNAATLTRVAYFANGVTQFSSPSYIQFGATSGYTFYDTKTFTNQVAKVGVDGTLYIAGTSNLANFFHLTGTPTGARTITFPDFSGTVPLLGSTANTGNLIVTGIIDGNIPITKVTAATFTFGAAYSTGYYLNQNATAATAITGTLGTATAGEQYCVTNSYNGTAADTGTITIQTSASGQYLISGGTISASGGYIISGGAAGDSACVVGIDSTHWQVYTSSGTWTLH